MKKLLKYLFSLEKKPKKGLTGYEWVVLAYMAFTFVLVALGWSRLPNAEMLAWGRIKVLAITLAMWGAYRMLPCGLMRCQTSFQICLYHIFNISKISALFSVSVNRWRFTI